MALVPVFYIEDGKFYLNGEMDVQQVGGNPCIMRRYDMTATATYDPDTSKRICQVFFNIAISNVSNPAQDFEPYVYFNGTQIRGGWQAGNVNFEIPANTNVSLTFGYNQNGGKVGGVKQVVVVMTREDNNTPINL